MRQGSAPKGKINITGFFILGLMLLLVVGAILTGFFFKGEEKLRVAMRNGQNVSFLVCGYNEDKVIKGGMVLIFNAKTNRIATIAVLPKTFLSYSRMENFTLEEALNKKVSFDNIRASVSKIIGYDINYYFFIQEANLIRLIDIMGGIEIYSNEIKDPQKDTYIPAGITLLDGDKSMEFLTYKSGDSIDE
jgi:anionic cell wall polymer biosynthesis LytR-Cps2A-Psr (LCP) family protein